jgi:[protein-PII] uridylyltransferase
LTAVAVSELQDSLAVRTAEVEEAVRRAFTANRFPSGVALLACGGFGRRELFPHSDIDLVFIVESEPQIAPMKASVSGFLQGLWDAGLRPSHAVHTVNYCTTDREENTELTISLLDRRLLTGDAAMSRWMDERFKAFLAKRGAAIADRLVLLSERRRAKFRNTVFHLEPNLKEGPGGLRDLQTVRWLAALTSRVTAPDLSAAFEFYAGLRVRMHESARRDQNLLSFDVQESLSGDPAELMRDYFRHARAVDRAARRAMETAKARPGNLVERFQDFRTRFSTSEFTVLREKVWLRAPAAVENGLQLFEFVARHQLRLAFDTLDRLEGCVPKTSWQDWRALLALPHANLGVRAMQESGVLAGAIPEWKRIDCLVVRDFYHHYTVDEHTLVALDSLAAIDNPRFADLWSEIDDPAIVRAALLLHDIGKGSGRDHVEESIELANAILERLKAPDADRAAVEFLIAHHLDLYTVMTSRDLSDQATAQMLASRVGTVERLKQLALLTYADLSAVNPGAMTPWRLEQLWSVYLLAHAELTKSLHAERIHEAEGARAAFLEGLPVRYLRTHSDSEIEGHMALARQLESRPVAIEIAHERGIYKLTLLTRDHPGLFSSVAGAISSFGLSILKAEAFSNAHGIVVDTFTFSDPHRSLELNPPEVDRLRGIVRKVVEGKLDAAQLLRGRPKALLPSRGARFEPRVRLDNSASATATLIEIVTEDRAGLLYDLTRAISAAGCNIDVVLIDTEAHRALDVLYVTAGSGGKLNEALCEELRTSLQAACSAS